MKHLIAAAGFALVATAAHADEGMWTLDNLPAKQMQERYGFTPTAEWIAKVQGASLRLAQGCSGSFVSADGLVMTNHHCANACLSQLSDAGHNYMQAGYSAAKREDEPRCPDLELNQLDSIADVTPAMADATKGKAGADYVTAQRAASSRIETDCVAGDAATWRCDVVSLYHGGRYALYKYRRVQDVRLVFAPSQDIAFFGGDPDNFNFPRYDLDLTFLRAYADGKPLHPTYFPFSPDGPKEGELVFTEGNPGSTSRDETVAQLTTLRDATLPRIRTLYSTLDGVLWEYSRRGAEQAKEAQDELFGVENTLKVFEGWQGTLADPALFERKRAAEAALKAWVDADPARHADYGDPWAAIAAAELRDRQLAPRFSMIEGRRGRAAGFQSELFGHARTLVRAAAERAKPDADRLPEFRDANLPALQQSLFSEAPVYPEFERTTLAFSLTALRQALGADDAFVHQVLGDASPEQRADGLVDGTKLADVAVRHALWDGGAAAVAASTDPMVVLARDVDPAARAVRKQHEDEVEAVLAKNSETVARARFARDGTANYPDATFSPRISFGTVKGWTEDDGREIPAFTDMAGLYRRATGADPFKLPQDWLDAKARLDPRTPFDFATTNDIIGGNSGSPVVDGEGHAVGLIFDGNIHSLGGDFAYDGRQNRAVAVDTAAILAALRQVYRNDALADELTAWTRKPGQ
ncbi:MAG: S46 family peptidase [Janthinobacterium lividum]